MSDKPAASPPPPPPRPTPRPPASKSRRRFITLFAVIGGLLALAPWAGFGPYLASSAGGATSSSSAQTIVLDDNTLENGNASGKTVNVNDLTTFPPNSTWTMTYPSSGNPTTDGQNPNTFVKFALIRLPKELGGANTNASAFVALSKVCVHLWCSPNYNPTQSTDPGENGYTAGTATHELYECPCHGSGYSVGLGVNGQGKQPVGLALIGPASVQPPPTNAIPLLTLQTDSAGNLQVVPPVWDVNHNGVVGYGRYTGSGAFTGGYSPQ